MADSNLGRLRELSRELSIAEARRQAILDSALDAIISIDEHGCIVEWNKTAETMFGYKGYEVIGKDMAELIIPPEIRGRHYAGMRRYFKSGEGPILDKRVELEGMNKEGHRFPIELTVVRVKGIERILFTGFIRDLTASKRIERKLREQVELYELIVNNVGDLITLVDIDGLVIYASPAFQTVLGYPGDELLGVSILDLVHPEDRALAEKSIHEAITSIRTSVVTIRIKNDEGEYITVETVNIAIRDEHKRPKMLLAISRIYPHRIQKIERQ